MSTISWAIALAALAAAVNPEVPQNDRIGISGPSPVTDLVLAPEGKLWIEGTSTVRGYSCEAKKIDGGVQLAPGTSAIEVSGLGAAVRGVALEFPIESLDCGNGKMNDHMRKALMSKDHPKVSFRVASHEVKPGEGKKGKIEMAGDLTIAGTTKRITIDAEAAPGADGKIQVSGSKEIDMTEWGVSPPRLMMGTLRVHEAVKVNFDLSLPQP